MQSNFLDKEAFQTVIENTPLVSIDLLIRNECDEILVGLRNNKPAKGYWFVPGGRILKGESIQDAFSRITLSELSFKASLEDATYLGLYEHFYPDSACDGEKVITTHYVVSGFGLSMKKNSLSELPTCQHSSYRWVSEKDFTTDETIHVHSRWYLDPYKGIKGKNI